MAHAWGVSPASTRPAIGSNCQRFGSPRPSGPIRICSTNSTRSRFASKGKTIAASVPTNTARCNVDVLVPSKRSCFNSKASNAKNSVYSRVFFTTSTSPLRVVLPCLLESAFKLAAARERIIGNMRTISAALRSPKNDITSRAAITVIAAHVSSQACRSQNPLGVTPFLGGK